MNFTDDISKSLKVSFEVAESMKDLFSDDLESYPERFEIVIEKIETDETIIPEMIFSLDVKAENVLPNQSTSSQYFIKIGNGYFAGFEDLVARIIFDDVLGYVKQIKLYDNKGKAEKEASFIGGEVETVEKYKELFYLID